MMTMTTERVFELIETYGAEPGGWPADEQRCGERPSWRLSRICLSRP